MADENAIDQGDIEKLLAGKSGKDTAPKSPKPEAAETSPPGDDAAGSAVDQSEIEKLLAGGGDRKATESPATQEADNQPPKAPEPQEKPAPPVTASSPDDNKALGQNDIENLLKGTIGAASTPPKTTTSMGIGMPQDSETDIIDEGVPRGDIDYLLRRAEEALESITSESGNLSNGAPEVIEFQFPEFGGSTPNSEHATLDQISEVELDIKIELGRTNMYLEDILKLRKGSVVALDKIAGDAVDIYVNERLIARGEVLVLNDNFCVRVAELLAGAIPIE